MKKWILKSFNLHQWPSHWSSIERIYKLRVAHSQQDINPRRCSFATVGYFYDFHGKVKDLQFAAGPPLRFSSALAEKFIVGWLNGLI